MGDVLVQLGVLLLHIAHKARAAGGGENALLRQLVRLPVCHHVGAQGHLGHAGEAQSLQSGHHLAIFGGGELPGDGGGDDGVGLIAPVLAAPQHLDGVHDPGLVLNGPEGALIDAVAAGDALVDVDGRLLVRAHGNGPGGAALFAGALGLDDGAVLAGVDAAAAGDALVVVDVGPVVHDGDGVLGAGVDAAGGQTTPAGGTHGDLGDGALVTGDGQHLHHAGVGLVAAHGQLHPAVDDGPLLIDAAAQAGPGAGDDLFGDIQNSGLGAVFPSQAGDLRQDRSFQLLDLCLKITHTSSFLQLFPVLSMVS